MNTTRGVVFGWTPVRTQFWDNGRCSATPSKLAEQSPVTSFSFGDALIYESPSRLAINQYLTYWDVLAFTDDTERLPRYWDELIGRQLGRDIESELSYEGRSLCQQYLHSNEARLLQQEGILRFIRTSALLDGFSQAMCAPEDTADYAKDAYWWCPSPVLAPYKYAARENRKEDLAWTVGHFSELAGRDDPVFLDLKQYQALPPSAGSHESPGNPGTDLIAKIYGALPVPGRDVPIERILDFRERRRPELLAMRAAIGDLSRKVSQEENTAEALATARDAIELALASLHRTLGESRISKAISSAEVYLALDEPSLTKIVWPAIGAITAGGAHMPVEIGALVGLGINATLTFIKRKRDGELAQVPSLCGDYVYAYRVGRELAP